VPVTLDAGTYTNGDVHLPRLDAIAAKDASGKLWLAVTNLDPEKPAEIEAELAGIHVKSATGETLTAPKVDSVNSFEAPNAVVPKPVSVKAQDGKLALKLEPKSVTVVALEQ
jgi:alpha-N-arabinofuranosidase